MNILDLPSLSLSDDRLTQVIPWPTCSREQAWGEALTADSAVIQAWAQQFQLSASPGLFTQARGLLMEWEFREGCATVWVEGRGTPFFDALMPEAQALDPQWVHACFQACWPQVSGPLGLLGLRSVQEHPRADALCFAWAVGAVRFAFVQCEERLFQRLSCPPGLATTEPDLWISSRLRSPPQCWTLTELRTMALGDGVIIAHSLARPVKVVWSLGQSGGHAPLMDWNWSANTMSWTGEQYADDMAGPAAQPHDDEECIDLNEVKIPISFELACGSFALSALRKIRPGQVVDLDCQPQQCLVKMVSLGRTLASGQLVQIGDSLALRIDKLYIKGEGPSP
ncbi:FliM/FliN family flagellar motor switch protein [Ideonella sp.]|jgi:flagellar motor switch/type III secretory pathway protein FliN|uniref:FliM/FliN family flagellar motor switch protein n=1 Tax=Ideonella sp. TaxID=1929293 RepID=UPI0037BE75BC